MSPLPISVCMISGAEAHRIRRALESVRGWTTEIVIVLNEDVADGTDCLAAEFGAKVFREPWKGFVGQRKSAIEKTTQPWLLGLDADEAVSDRLRAEIMRLFAREPEPARYAAYSFPRCTFYCGRWIRHGDWYPDRKVRLWRRGRAQVVGGELHETMQVDGAVGRLRGDLLHYSMEDLNHQVAKTVTYSDYFVRQWQQRNRPVSFTELLVRPWWRFCRAYFLRLGFLDGWQGYTIAGMGAFHTLLRYAKVREMQKSSPDSDAPPGHRSR
jgi:glycosyltransferase involved in cell wall biosynthesis